MGFGATENVYTLTLRHTEFIRLISRSRFSGVIHVCVFSLVLRHSPAAARPPGAQPIPMRADADREGQKVRRQCARCTDPEARANQPLEFRHILKPSRDARNETPNGGSGKSKLRLQPAAVISRGGRDTGDTTETATPFVYPYGTSSFLDPRFKWSSPALYVQHAPDGVDRSCLASRSDAMLILGGFSVLVNTAPIAPKKNNNAASRNKGATADPSSPF